MRGRVTASTKQEFCVDQSVFYPLGGGQPGDVGTASWDEQELDENPSLVRTMSVQPPRGKGDIRIGKVEKKGRRNRRVNIHFDD